MKITVTVKTGVRSPHSAAVDTSNKNCYIVRVRERPHDGTANEAVQRTLAKHFGVPKSSVVIVRGHRARKKIIEIMTGQ